MNELVIATSNSGKLREIQHYFRNFSIKLSSQAQYQIKEVPETGSTFVENALIKAKNATKQTGKASLADDSGLVIPILNGRPGIFSARYAGSQCKDSDNIGKILHEIKALDSQSKQADSIPIYFYCCMVLLRYEADPAPLISFGRWNGKLLIEPRGNDGFGYDPIFWVPELQCSAAELNLDEKNRLSHRGQALTNMMNQFNEHI